MLFEPKQPQARQYPGQPEVVVVGWPDPYFLPILILIRPNDLDSSALGLTRKPIEREHDTQRAQNSASQVLAGLEGLH